MWLFIPTASASSPCVPASACSTKGCGPDSLSSAEPVALWVTVNGTPSRRPASWPGWKNRPWSQRLFRMIWQTLIGGGAAASIGSWLASLASHGATPASKRGRATSAGSGRLSIGSDWTFDRATGCWKTCQGSFLAEGLPPSSPILPRAGGMRSGSIYRRPAWEPATCGNGFSSWPTIRSHEVGGWQEKDGRTFLTLGGAIQLWPTPNTAPEAPNGGLNRGNGEYRKRDSSQCLGELASLWSTPAASDDKRGTSPYSEAELNRERGCPMTLAKDVSLWTTPNAMAGGSVSRGGDRIDDPLLAGQAAMWATPMRSDDGDKVTAASKIGLIPQVAQWATPASRDYRSPNATSFQERSESTKGEQLVNQVEHHFLPPDQKQTGGRSRKCSTRRLNPAFVCWLMGMPWYWTRPEPINSAAPATASWRCALARHLSSLCDGPASSPREI